MSEGLNTELVSRLRKLKVGDDHPSNQSLGEDAADALESTSRALSEKEGEYEDLKIKLALAGPLYSARQLQPKLDEALAALKASEEREAKLIRKLASARFRPESSSVRALKWSVKRFQWKDGRTAETVFSVVQIAKILGSEQMVGLEYMILVPDRHGLCEVVLGSKIIASRGSEDEARSAAQQDYEQRIHCCLALENGPAALADATKKDSGTEQREASV
ncbi:hypothetical protein [Bosea sp. UC22_33]|uniref:hypothetical protein n=1 Tax=Bosea sp. UC22_33 TaxID=3350165 RepID=UPI0036721D6D